MVSSLIFNSHFFAFFCNEFLKLTCLVAVLPGYGTYRLRGSIAWLWQRACTVLANSICNILANSICNIHEFNSFLSLYINM
jgi:hypothetical protein